MNRNSNTIPGQLFSKFTMELVISRSRSRWQTLLSISSHTRHTKKSKLHLYDANT